MSTLKILFVSRAYPPIIGGIENQNAGIAKALKKATDTKIIANTKGKSFLPFFIPYVCIKILFTLPRYDVLLIGDGVLAPVARLAKWFFPKKKYASIIHGLDITYSEKPGIFGQLYKNINIPALKKLDKLIMVGRYTVSEALKAGIPENRCTFIPNGFAPEEFAKKWHRSDLEKHIQTDLTGKKVLLRIGRFVEHKGVPWFIENVMPTLPKDIVLIAAGGRVTSAFGDADAFEKARALIKKNDLSKRVFLLENCKWEEICMLYATADLYISPNITVTGSAEGFGINAIEAAASKTTVLSADLQGLKDAIHEGRNGFLVEHENAAKWQQKIKELLSPSFDRDHFGRTAAIYTKEQFAWEKISEKYLHEFSKLK